MLIIPAIDLKDGCVVRYVQGRTDKKVYSKDPVKTARHWVKLGAEMLHVVDLDGAFSGVPRNIAIAKDIAKSVSVPVEFGGGVRNITVIDELIKAGLGRVILGTRAVKDIDFLKKVFKKYADKVIVSIDVSGGNIMVEGWKASSKEKGCTEFALVLKGLGFRQIIYTDTLKDGTLSGPNIKGIKSLLKETGLKIIASGGISGLEDLRKLKTLEKSGVAGVIIGKALYEGRFTLTEAIKIG